MPGWFMARTHGRPCHKDRNQFPQSATLSPPLRYHSPMLRRIPRAARCCTATTHARGTHRDPRRRRATTLRSVPNALAERHFLVSTGNPKRRRSPGCRHWAPMTVCDPRAEESRSHSVTARHGADYRRFGRRMSFSAAPGGGRGGRAGQGERDRNERCPAPPEQGVLPGLRTAPSTSTPTYSMLSGPGTETGPKC